MVKAILAGFIYFTLVFAIGFALGIVRMNLLIPRMGELAAVGMEAPVMLAFAWLICRHLTRRFAIGPEIAPRLVMGGFAFTMLMFAELVLSVIFADRTPAEHWALYRGVAQQVGLTAQLVFAAFPLVQRRHGNAA